MRLGMLTIGAIKLLEKRWSKKVTLKTIYGLNGRASGI